MSVLWASYLHLSGRVHNNYSVKLSQRNFIIVAELF